LHIPLESQQYAAVIVEGAGRGGVNPTGWGWFSIGMGLFTIAFFLWRRRKKLSGLSGSLRMSLVQFVFSFSSSPSCHGPLGINDPAQVHHLVFWNRGNILVTFVTRSDPEHFPEALQLS